MKIPMKVPHGRKIEDKNDLVLIFNHNDEVIDFGSVGYTAYKDEPLRWNEENGYYELVNLPGYKMVCVR